MGKISKKGKAGAATKFITRSQALKRLQLGLADFRRLCILKGIYPRDPKNKRKANPSASSHTAFYYLKDIQFLAHEPLLHKTRELKAFNRKLKKYLGRHDLAKAQFLETNLRPTYSLDHLVRERYPSFVDALRDLDDALSMLALFSTLPKSQVAGHQAEISHNCARLMREFEAYVMRSGSLKRSFISIKGIYYQAEILGQPITWIVPHQFSTPIPTDVDFRIMLTFLEFYQTLLGFVNLKLFSRLGWTYPSAFGDSLMVVSLSDMPPVEDDTSMEGERLFGRFVVFVSREVPLGPVSFVLQALGARIGWESDDESSGIQENDAEVTHQIVDRPALSRMLVDRHYVQPQWVFDCLNANQVLDVGPYRAGQPLPPHLSPFATEEKDDDDSESGEESEPTKKPAALDEKKERKQLAISMMPKKHQKLYRKMQHTRKRKLEEKKKLAKRRDEITGAIKGK